jgi:hypothetical protein
LLCKRTEGYGGGAHTKYIKTAVLPLYLLTRWQIVSRLGKNVLLLKQKKQNSSVLSLYSSLCSVKPMEPIVTTGKILVFFRFLILSSLLSCLLILVQQIGLGGQGENPPSMLSKWTPQSSRSHIY